MLVWPDRLVCCDVATLRRACADRRTSGCATSWMPAGSGPSTPHLCPSTILSSHLPFRSQSTHSLILHPFIVTLVSRLLSSCRSSLTPSTFPHRTRRLTPRRCRPGQVRLRHTFPHPPPQSGPSSLTPSTFPHRTRRLNPRRCRAWVQRPGAAVAVRGGRERHRPATLEHGTLPRKTTFGPPLLSVDLSSLLSAH